MTGRLRSRRGGMRPPKGTAQRSFPARPLCSAGKAVMTTGHDRRGDQRSGQSPPARSPLPAVGRVTSVGFRPAATGEMRVAVRDRREMSSIRSDGCDCRATTSDDRRGSSPYFLYAAGIKSHPGVAGTGSWSPPGRGCAHRAAPIRSVSRAAGTRAGRVGRGRSGCPRDPFRRDGGGPAGRKQLENRNGVPAEAWERGPIRRFIQTIIDAATRKEL
jgi:hypothetical protein